MAGTPQNDKIQYWVNRIAETYLKAGVQIPSDIEPKGRNQMMLLGMIRALVTMGIQCGHDRVNILSAVAIELDAMQKAVAIAEVATRLQNDITRAKD